MNQLRTSTKRKQTEVTLAAVMNVGSQEETVGGGMSHDSHMHAKSRKLNHSTTVDTSPTDTDSDQTNHELEVPMDTSPTAVPSTELAVYPSQCPILMNTVTDAATASGLLAQSNQIHLSSATASSSASANPADFCAHRDERIRQLEEELRNVKVELIKAQQQRSEVPVRDINQSTTKIWCLKIVEGYYDFKYSHSEARVQFFYSEAEAQQALIRAKREREEPEEYNSDTDSDEDGDMDENEPDPLIDVYSHNPTQPYNWSKKPSKPKFDLAEFDRKFDNNYSSNGFAYYDLPLFMSTIFEIEVQGKRTIPTPSKKVATGSEMINIRDYVCTLDPRVQYEQTEITTFFQTNKKPTHPNFSSMRTTATKLHPHA